MNIFFIMGKGKKATARQVWRNKESSMKSALGTAGLPQYIVDSWQSQNVKVWAALI